MSQCKRPRAMKAIFICVWLLGCLTRGTLRPPCIRVLGNLVIVNIKTPSGWKGWKDTATKDRKAWEGYGEGEMNAATLFPFQIQSVCMAIL